ncbi:hypothetical protein ACFFX0_07630 [Citricoccus parietis]|uniref:Uncharacterized protein n=1 Tax=Citricoccus parietis TaxID=592307 RepID=A0ABV5FXX0_9MICC
MDPVGCRAGSSSPRCESWSAGNGGSPNGSTARSGSSWQNVRTC